MLGQYSPLERWLHWLALEPLPVRQLSFDLERLHSLPHRPTPAERAAGIKDPADGAVYVCGLARSGTTILLQILDQLDCFRSPTYRDMPFVLAPNLWRKLSRLAQKDATQAERPHGDGMMVGYDSPEAFEEVFWRTFGSPKITADSFDYDPPTQETLDAFADYRALVANPRTESRPEGTPFKRYLSKNNNNLLRLPALCADPSATVLIVFRDPVETAQSLHRVHMRFCASQANNPFMKNYMNWLCHYEFGLNHKALGISADTSKLSPKPEKLEYWLTYWNKVHRFILNKSACNYILVSHSALCSSPKESIEKIVNVTGASHNISTLSTGIEKKPPLVRPEIDKQILDECYETYSALTDSPKNLLKQPQTNEHAKT